jgi:hypothetical protein
LTGTISETLPGKNNILKKNKIVSCGSNIGKVMTNMHKLNEITCEENSYLEAPCHRMVKKNPSLNGNRIFLAMFTITRKFFPLNISILRL